MAPDIADCGSGKPHVGAEASVEEIPLQEIKHASKETRTDLELQEFHEHHCRLLPNYKNAIHVIDGPEHRYFVGIIDIFTVYGWKKRLEHLWKSIRYPGKDFSTVSPTKYSHRFCKWIQDHTQWGYVRVCFSLILGVLWHAVINDNMLFTVIYSIIVEMYCYYVTNTQCNVNNPLRMLGLVVIFFLSCIMWLYFPHTFCVTVCILYLHLQFLW